MIAATGRWFRRNRNGIALGVGVVGAGYLAGQYVLSKISEARERMSSERIARENLRRRFEQNQTDCTFTVLALLPTATENILEALPVEDLTHELQQKKAERLAKVAGEGTSSEISSDPPSVTDDDGRSLASFQSESYVHASQMAESSAGGEGLPQRPRRSKAQLWNELKISSVTRSFTLLYTLSLLTLLTRIQLNLLGRRNYLSSVVSLASPHLDSSTISLENHDDDNIGQAFGNDFETNRRYLTFSWWLLHKGWRELMTKVEGAVEEVFGPINPREDITMARLSELTLAVRKKVEGATEEERRSTKWLPYLLPPRDLEDHVLQESGVLPTPESSESPAPPTSPTSPLRRLLDETSDLIDSPSFTRILTLLLNAAFSHLIDTKVSSQAYPSSTRTPPSTPLQQQPAAALDSAVTITPLSSPDAPKTKLATILAVLTRQAHSIGNGTNPPNEYLGAMESGCRELEAFAAVVYSSNFEWEAPGASSWEDISGLSGEAGKSQGSPRPVSGVEESLVDVGREGESVVGGEGGQTIEGAWGRARDTTAQVVSERISSTG